MKRILITILLLLLATSAYSGELLTEGYWNYLALDAANLTSEYAARVFGTDQLVHDSGSDSLNSDKVTEHLNTYQGSVELWVELYFDSDYTGTIYLLDTGFVDLYWDGASTQWKATVNGVSITKSDTFRPGEETYILLTWETQGADSLDLEIDGSSATTITTTQTPGTPASIYTGQDSGSTNTWQGLIAGRICDAVVTSNYNGGDGTRYGTFLIDRTTSLAWNFTELATSITYRTFGKTVSAITAGGTEATLTTAAGSDTVFVENDDVIVEGGCGDYVQGKVDDTVTSESITVDDGSGGAVANIDEVGVDIHCDAQYSAVVSSANYHNVTTNDLGLWAWIKCDIDAGNNFTLIMKGGSVRLYKAYFLNGVPRVYITGAVNNFYATGTADLRDGKWHHVAVIIDKSNGANCKVYIDAVDDTASRTGDVTTVGTLNQTSYSLNLGRNSSGGASFFDGYIAEAGICYPPDIMAAGEMGASGEILKLATNPHNPSAWCETEDYWLLDEDTGTTLTGNTYDLTLSNVAAWELSAFLTRDLVVDSDMESALGSISDTSIDATITVSKDSDTVCEGTQSQKIEFTASDDAVALELRSFTGELDRDYFYRFLINFASIHASSDLYLLIDGSGSIVSRQLNTGTDDYGTSYAVDTWLMFEGGFTGDQDGAYTISFSITGAGAGTNAAVVYIDKLEALASLVVNGGMEGTYTGAGTIFIAPGWAGDGLVSGTDTAAKETTIVHSGLASQKIIGAGASHEGIYQVASLSADKYYTASIWLRGATGGEIVEFMAYYFTNNHTEPCTLTTNWQKFSFTFTPGADATGQIIIRVGAGTFYIDDVSFIRDDTRAASTATKGDGHYPLELWQIHE